MAEKPFFVEPHGLIGWRTWWLKSDQDPLYPDPWSVSAPGETDQREGEGDDGQFRLETGARGRRLETEWPPRERLVARCRFKAYAISAQSPNPDEHHAPDPDCSCGIYAARSHRILRDMGYAAGPDDNHAPDLVGEVWMWGRAMESSEGLRAEFAYPKKLFVQHVHWRWAKPLAETYGVPVEIKNPFEMEVD